ncbi:DUF465 domain-containing protein [Fundidesulfovibrio putealis]|jgi:uncharacterized protein|uniref:DUF465 domain-containing protein n=1 Tax=Fundidesulfovibrio putealis TaxID=270496 RepID=UPI00041A4B31|nr:DUF465 domain-containing protein [Fundidesulfovibrio putealis]KAF0232474.1 MAG: hypothetical protein FD177_2486 [Desulfovibrionaceae bacterium]
MDSRDLELIAKHSESDVELRALYSEHVAFDKLIDKLEGKSFLNATEDLEIKELKKKKLAGKTRIQTILDKYRQAEAN